MMKMIPVFSALRRLRLSCGRKQGAANDPRQHFGGRLCNCGFFVTITVRGLPSRFHFHFGYTKYHHRVKIYGPIEPSPTFGTVATISVGCCPKLWRITGPLYYALASVLFGGTMLPLEITRKLRHQSLLFPLAHRSTFRPERERRFNFSRSFVPNPLF